MPNGGHVAIAVDNVVLDENYAAAHPGETPGDYVKLSVRDTGTGMTDEVKAHLFEAFFTTKPVGKGTGLGLATCQSIVRRCGGHIDVTSEVGAGTTFNVYFPRVADASCATAEPNQIAPAGGGSETLLIVEDEASLLTLARTVLEKRGYKVLSASNGCEGLRVAREHKETPIALVVTDVIMPLMGGKVMADELAIDHPLLKILFMSGYTDDAIAHHGVLNSGVQLLSKPYTPEALARKVRECLDAPAKGPPAEPGIADQLMRERESASLAVAAA
jgi:CheY-like chemotaxis protein